VRHSCNDFSPLHVPAASLMQRTLWYQTLFRLCGRAVEIRDVAKLSVHSIYLVHQYNETNVMHFPFNLLRIKSLYMFRALLAHPREALHIRHLVYCVRIMSVGCGTVAVSLQACRSQLTLYARNVPSAVC
jgi:hypothetical protein